MKKMVRFSSLLLAGGVASCASVAMESTDWELMGLKPPEAKQQPAERLSVARRPNILLMVVDDQGFADIGYKGMAKGVETPNLDRLAAQSAVFETAYASSPVCSPARCGILTGTYQARWGNYWFGGPGVPEGAPTLADEFSKLGYETSYVGKFHYGEDNPASRPQNHGFHYSLTAPHGGRSHYLYHSKAAVQRYGEAAAEWKMNVLPMLENGKPIDNDGFTTEIYAAKALERMKAAAAEQKPFFVELAFNAVHNFAWQLPKAYLQERGLPELSDWNPELETYWQWYPGHIKPFLPNGRDYYLAQLHYMDREVGKLLDFLDQSGLRENTIVVWISDNGGSNCNWADNTPLRGTKYTLYEGGIRVPYMISWPGTIQPKSISEVAVMSLDLLPTLLEACGLRYFNCDGLSLMPILTGKEATLNREVLVWDTGFTYAVRKGDWKLKVVNHPSHAHTALYPENSDPGKPVELYYIAQDPSESIDLSARFPEKVNELKRYHAKWKAEMQKTQQENLVF